MITNNLALIKKNISKPMSSAALGNKPSVFFLDFREKKRLMPYLLKQLNRMMKEKSKIK